MDYKLCKQLEDVGFPFDFKESKMGDDTYTFPSLGELIDACGDGYFKLEHTQCVWEAESTLKRISAMGKTPTEAVAKLWLRLNKK